MPEVYNWQLKREMEYPFEGVRSRRQFAAVFNTNRCINCQTCTMACKSTWTFSKGQEHMWWNNVETKPYGGYPQGYDVKILSKLGSQEWENGRYVGKTVFEAAPTESTVLGYLPSDDEWRHPNIHEEVPTPYPRIQDGKTQNWSELPEHLTYFFKLQRICNHCTYPACLASCPRKAIYKRPEDGIILIDQQRCRGYRECVAACPYKRPMYNGVSRVSEKCIACYPRVERGEVTRCIAACVGKIRLQGWVKPPEEAVPDHPIDYLVHVAKVALPLYPQLGLEANVYYIPPRYAPRAYLRQMFGPGVDKAIEKYMNMDHELLGLMQLFGVTRKIIERFRITEKDAIGFDANNTEIIRVPIEDEVTVRPGTFFNTT